MNFLFTASLKILISKLLWILPQILPEVIFKNLGVNWKSLNKNKFIWSNISELEEGLFLGVLHLGLLQSLDLDLSYKPTMWKSIIFSEMEWY
jgi:hypothetical protein